MEKGKFSRLLSKGLYQKVMSRMFRAGVDLDLQLSQVQGPCSAELLAFDCASFFIAYKSTNRVSRVSTLHGQAPKVGIWLASQGFNKQVTRLLSRIFIFSLASSSSRGAFVLVPIFDTFVNIFVINHYPPFVPAVAVLTY
jgi:hypothetical protein